MKRQIIQLLSLIASNSYIQGFLNSTIYKGNLKVTCVPGLNCYSCPGARGSCPIGALQAVSGTKEYSISLYVLGFLMAFGILLGRVICGFLCPFGFFQDILYKIRIKKINVPPKIDKPLRYFKYIILVVFVVILPTFLNNDYGISSPYFCKLVCPVGTLEGGIPLVLGNEGLRSMVGFLFGWKMLILISVIIFSVFIYRPFCKYLCPLGAIYGLFNKFSFYQMAIDEDKCIKCKRCESVCNMGVKFLSNQNDSECIRCGDCKNICPKDAIFIKYK